MANIYTPFRLQVFNLFHLLFNFSSLQYTSSFCLPADVTLIWSSSWEKLAQYLQTPFLQTKWCSLNKPTEREKNRRNVKLSLQV